VDWEDSKVFFTADSLDFTSSSYTFSSLIVVCSYEMSCFCFVYFD
jgi:hypothetical protein